MFSVVTGRLTDGVRSRGKKTWSGGGLLRSEEEWRSAGERQNTCVKDSETSGQIKQQGGELVKPRVNHPE